MMTFNTDSDVMGKNTYGLKQIKKAQKAKQLAKRTAAAQKATMNKTRFASIKFSGTNGTMSTPAASAEEELLLATSDPEGTLDIAAYRKALESALYEKMETPVQMLIRCKYKLSIDAEYHIEYDNSTTVAPQAAYLDDNGFETISCMTSSNTYNDLAAGESYPSAQEGYGIDNTVIYLPRAPQAPQCSRVSLDQLFIDVTGKEKIVTASSQKMAKARSRLRSPPSTETEKRTITHFTQMPPTRSYSPNLTDPAIVCYKNKQQAGSKKGFLTTNNSGAIDRHAMCVNNSDSLSSRIRTISISTPDSSPSSQHSSASSPTNFSAGSWTPPTPHMPSMALRFPAHYPHVQPRYNNYWRCFGHGTTHWPKEIAKGYQGRFYGYGCNNRIRT